MSYASFLQRISSASIDGIVYVFFFSFVIGDGQRDSVLLFPSLMLAVITVVLVTSVLLVRYSGTPGKLLLNCQVVDAQSGNPIGFRQAVLRSMGMFITTASFGLGFLWILFDRNKQALHDKIAHTIVVYNGTIDMFDESQKTLQQLLSEVR